VARVPGVRFEPVGEAHLADVRRLISDPDVLRFSRTPEPVPDGYERVWLERVLAGRREGRMEVFMAYDLDGAFVGMALAPSIDRDTAEAELGYSVVPEARGRGFATAILRQLTDWAFASGVLRATLIIDLENAASERVAVNAGYTREGVMRSLHQKGSRRVDAGLWSRLPDDPRPG
jgi:RimJ/RimL family protein N-acetyltransferase